MARPARGAFPTVWCQSATGRKSPAAHGRYGLSVPIPDQPLAGQIRGTKAAGASWRSGRNRSSFMKQLLTGVAVAVMVAGAAVPAQAKGCLKGALVGGVAGHFAGRHG